MISEGFETEWVRSYLLSLPIYSGLVSRFKILNQNTEYSIALKFYYQTERFIRLFIVASRPFTFSNDIYLAKRGYRLK